MKKESLLTVTVVLLLLMNFGILGYLFVAQKKQPHFPPPHGPRVDQVIINTLGYDDQQQREFEKLKHQHRGSIIALDEEYEEVLLQYFNLLKADTAAQAKKDSLEQTLCSIQTRKAAVTFSHFQDLKNLCTAEQKPKFDLLIPELMPIIMPPKGPHHPPR